MILLRINKFNEILAIEEELKPLAWKFPSGMLIAANKEKAFTISPILSQVLIDMGIVREWAVKEEYYFPTRVCKIKPVCVNQVISTLQKLEVQEFLLFLMRIGIEKEYDDLIKLKNRLSLMGTFVLDARINYFPEKFWIGKRNSENYMRYIQFHINLVKYPIFNQCLRYLCGLYNMEMPNYDKVENFRDIIKSENDVEQILQRIYNLKKENN